MTPMADSIPTPTAADPWFQPLFADRIGGANYGKGTEIYKFEKIKRAKRAAVRAHPERRVLRFGIGEKDDLAPAPARGGPYTEGDKPADRRVARHRIPALNAAAPGVPK